MAIPSHIVDPHNGLAARVTEFGQLVVAPIAYSTASSATLAIIDTAYNFIEPKGGHQIVITDVILTSDRLVGANGASVQLYTATSPISTDPSPVMLDIEMLKNTSRDLIGLNLLVTKGRWVNAKTNDNNIQITIGYYRVPME